MKIRIVEPEFEDDLLLRLLEASPEKWATIQRVLAGQPLPDLEPDTASSPPKKGESAHVFRWTGRLWEVIFCGGRPFYLENTLGARYLDYLLHRPNVPLAAFDLEVAITPEKGEARTANSIQPSLDGRARREYRAALQDLREHKERAQHAGDSAKAHEFESQIKAVEDALEEGGGADDTGERARGNVSKAVRLVLRSLLRGGEDEKAFARHVQDALSLGYDCLYSRPAGQAWD